jgi:hypothetical protein
MVTSKGVTLIREVLKNGGGKSLTGLDSAGNVGSSPLIQKKCLTNYKSHS